MENLQTDVPAEVKGWNWGAFMFTFVWGLANKTYLPLLTLIPGFGLIWAIITGFKGNEWAWKDGDYTDVATFKRVQSTWNRAGAIQLGIYVLFGVLWFAFIGTLLASLATAFSSF